MGFYSPAVLVKDAQRHGLRVKPVDVLRSSWLCTLEKEANGTFSLRLGLRYVRGLRLGSAAELEAAREMRPARIFQVSLLVVGAGRAEEGLRADWQDSSPQ